MDTTVLSGLKWTVEAGVDLILPDSVALACGKDGLLMPLLFTRAADVCAVVMPVSANRLLIGLAADGESFDVETFNTQAAASCETFFIGAKPFDAHGLSPLIGSTPAKAIQEAVSAAAREVEQPSSTIDSATDPFEPQAYTRQNFSFNVRLADFGEESLANKFAEILDSIVDALAQDLPLHELDGITIAIDYHAALAEIDRGDPDLPPATSGALGYSQSVFKIVTVIRGGVRKEHLVVAAWLAETWLSSDSRVRATGIYTLVKMLAEVAHSSLYAKARETAFTPGVMEREFHLAVACTPPSYWSARYAAFVEPDQGQIYSDLVVDSLAFADREIAARRARIPESGDIADTTLRARECVSAVLGHAADWLGHRAGLTEGQSFTGSDLSDRLKTYGLDRWLDLFGRDLAACYGSDGALDLEVVTQLSSHVERLFWRLGVYCWPEDEDVRCLVTEHFFLPPK